MKKAHNLIRQFYVSLFTYIGRELGAYEKVAGTGLTPNGISCLGILCAVITGFLLATNVYSLQLLGMFFAQLTFFCDNLDGNVARLKGIQSVVGEWVDLTCSQVADFFVLLGVTIGAYQHNPSVYIWLLGFFAIGFRFLNKNLQISLTSLAMWNEMVDYSGEKKFMKQFLYTRHLIYFLLIWACLFNKLYWYFLFISFYGFLFYFTSVVFIYRKLTSSPRA